MRYSSGLKLTFNVITVAGSIAAAGLWWYASKVNVPPVPGQPGIAFGDMDLYPTLLAGSYWNRLAAMAAGIAAIGQAFATIIEMCFRGAPPANT